MNYGISLIPNEPTLNPKTTPALHHPSGVAIDQLVATYPHEQSLPSTIVLSSQPIYFGLTHIPTTHDIQFPWLTNTPRTCHPQRFSIKPNSPKLVICPNIPSTQILLFCLAYEVSTASTRQNFQIPPLNSQLYSLPTLKSTLPCGSQT